MQKAPPTPKGFRDIQPELAKKRRGVIGKIVEVLEEFEFVPIETPTIEFAETLKGKYGEEERLIYQFKDRGGRELALRYDLTVPLARYVATYHPPLPFRRYQIGQVFRGENPQKGRFREFTQLDFDTVGSERMVEDTKIIAAALKIARHLGLKNAKMFINHRVNFEGIPIDFVRAIDKIYKIGMDGVKKELLAKKYEEKDINNYIEKVTEKLRENINTPSFDLFKINTQLQDEYKLTLGQDYDFDANLARGLDYYTGTIFELKPNSNPESLTIGAGGRYDNLIGMFSKKQVPAVGFSFGVDRLIEVI
ncbi:histidine--tRNA ligase [Candidatus Microgenomates bacterium]|nr:histidine--tRNA ligase [Candidatus Microgenomates bacterium]